MMVGVDIDSDQAAYRRLEPNMQIIDYDCVSYFWQRQQKLSSTE